MTYSVVFSPDAEDHLDELYRYIADLDARHRGGLRRRDHHVLRAAGQIPAPRPRARRHQARPAHHELPEADRHRDRPRRPRLRGDPERVVISGEELPGGSEWQRIAGTCGAVMIDVDLVADLDAGEDEGFGWSTLADAPLPGPDHSWSDAVGRYPVCPGRRPGRRRGPRRTGSLHHPPDRSLRTAICSATP